MRVQRTLCYLQLDYLEVSLSLLRGTFFRNNERSTKRADVAEEVLNLVIEQSAP
jgi:hypothetical protein